MQREINKSYPKGVQNSCSVIVLDAFDVSHDCLVTCVYGCIVFLCTPRLIDEERLKAEEAQRKVILNLNASGAVARLMIQAKARHRRPSTASIPSALSSSSALTPEQNAADASGTPAAVGAGVGAGVCVDGEASGEPDVAVAQESEGGEGSGQEETPAMLTRDALRCYERALQMADKNRYVSVSDFCFFPSGVFRFDRPGFLILCPYFAEVQKYFTVVLTLRSRPINREKLFLFVFFHACSRRARALFFFFLFFEMFSSVLLMCPFFFYDGDALSSIEARRPNDPHLCC